MSRNLHVALIIVAAAGAALLFYKTNPGEGTAPIAQFGGVSLRLEYATTETGRQRGLAGREYLAPDQGMLFFFPKEGNYGFWMKETLIPLDIFWLNPSAGGGSASGGQGNVLKVVSMALDVDPSTYPNVFYPGAPAQYVLETAAGFARANGVGTGTPLLLKNLPGVSK